MPDPVPEPLDLTYSTYSAGVVSWQRERDLLLITIHEPPPSPRSPNWWWPVLATWALLLVATLTGFSFRYGVGPAATRAALLVTGVFILGHTLLIRVNAHKLLIDESGRNLGGDTHIHVSVTGRAYAADEITGVTAANGTLRVKTRTRRLAPFSVSGYDPGDLAFAADTIRKVLAEGVDAWVASQAPVIPQAAP